MYGWVEWMQRCLEVYRLGDVGDHSASVASSLTDLASRMGFSGLDFRLPDGINKFTVADEVESNLLTFVCLLTAVSGLLSPCLAPAEVLRAQAQVLCAAYSSPPQAMSGDDTGDETVLVAIWGFHSVFITNAALCVLPLAPAELIRRVWTMYQLGGWMAKQVDAQYISCQNKPWQQHDWVSDCFRLLHLVEGRMEQAEEEAGVRAAPPPPLSADELRAGFAARRSSAPEMGTPEMAAVLGASLSLTTKDVRRLLGLLQRLTGMYLEAREELKSAVSLRDVACSRLVVLLEETILKGDRYVLSPVRNQAEARQAASLAQRWQPADVKEVVLRIDQLGRAGKCVSLFFGRVFHGKFCLVFELASAEMYRNETAARAVARLPDNARNVTDMQLLCFVLDGLRGVQTRKAPWAHLGWTVGQ